MPRSEWEYTEAKEYSVVTQVRTGKKMIADFALHVIDKITSNFSLVAPPPTNEICFVVIWYTY